MRHELFSKFSMMKIPAAQLWGFYFAMVGVLFRGRSVAFFFVVQVYPVQDPFPESAAVEPGVFHLDPGGQRKLFSRQNSPMALADALVVRRDRPSAENVPVCWLVQAVLAVHWAGAVHPEESYQKENPVRTEAVSPFSPKV